MKIIKKVSLFLLFLLFTILLNSCIFKEMDSVNQIVIAEKPYKTIVFVKSTDGSSNKVNFLVKVKDGDNTYLEEGKMHNGNFVYKKIMEDRNFEVLNLYDNSIFLRNDDGLQEIVYEFRSSYYKNNVLSDMLVFLKTDGFDEVIKGQNTNQYLELINNTEERVVSNVENGSVWAIGTYKNKTVNATGTIYDKKQYYVYEDNDNLLVSETKQIYQLSKSTNGETYTDELENVNSVNTILEDCYQIKKVVLATWLDKTYIYIIDYNENIFCYDPYAKTMSMTSAYMNIDEIAQFEDKIYLLIDNKIIILDHNFKEIATCCPNNNETILGLTWYKDYTNSNLLYMYIKGDELILDSYA